jgi:hypothetical protein
LLLFGLILVGLLMGLQASLWSVFIFLATVLVWVLLPVSGHRGVALEPIERRRRHEDDRTESQQLIQLLGVVGPASAFVLGFLLGAR